MYYEPATVGSVVYLWDKSEVLHQVLSFKSLRTRPLPHIGQYGCPRGQKRSLDYKFLAIYVSKMAAYYYIGVDVGTASVRAALVASDGKIVSCATRPLQIWQPLPDYYEQSSQDVWRNVCLVVKVSSYYG